MHCAFRRTYCELAAVPIRCQFPPCSRSKPLICLGSPAEENMSFNNVDPKSSARKWIGVFGNGALHIAALIVLPTSSILN
jgi:hypothetical protein